MSYVFGYVDVTNDMYAVTGSTGDSTTHRFSNSSWTKVATNVKQAVISNEDYDNACDGYISMSGSLYVWRGSTLVLMDTDVKQADSAEDQMLAYVKNDNTLWLANIGSTSYKRQVATNVDYVVLENYTVAYKSLDGKGYFANANFGTAPSATFYSVDAVQDVAASGANSNYRGFRYLNQAGELYGSTSPAGSFTRLASNVKSIKKSGYGTIFLTQSNDLYGETNMNTPGLITSNVLDYWDNRPYSGTLSTVFYTTLDEPTKLKFIGNQLVPAPTPVKTLGSTYGRPPASVRVEVSASDDGITFSPYAFFNPTTLPQKRFLKFRAVLNGGAQVGDKKTFEFDQASPESKLVINEFLAQVGSDVKVNAIHKIDGILNETYTDGKLFEIPIDRTKYKSITKIEVI
ncbi:hypothetical protein [Bacillus thuringiensis]|uniref:hypothetical protein n=1 Tax=Bacillus thuringiensis TaxID=1428 RepID=UPI000BFA25A5|nr:hypothetical protein [Bacillus thuringiensis]PEV23300.1 hypothetical protein CN420_19600 [Bacillus thuringiensis]